MSSYQVTLKDRTMERIEGADAYQQEGQMTTFFCTASGRNVVDTWSTRIASFRTSEVVIIRRLDPVAAELGQMTTTTLLSDDGRAAAGDARTWPPCR
jgi:hypothetical protein